MVQINIAGFGIGVGLNEIMVVATSITILIALLVPITDAFESKKSLNVLDYPGSFVNAFNNLWFDDFSFFKDTNNTKLYGGTTSTCTVTLKKFGSVSYEKPSNVSGNSTAEQKAIAEASDVSGEVITDSWAGFVGGLPVIGGALLALKLNSIFEATGPIITNTPLDPIIEVVSTVTNKITTGLYAGALLLYDILTNMLDVFLGCGLSGIRLIIGISVVFYLLFHSMGIITGLMSVLGFLIGH